MSLRLGQWKMNSNGTESILTLSGVDQNGDVVGDLNGDKVRGVWDEASRTLIFGVKPPLPSGVPPSDPLQGLLRPYLYKGFLFSTPTNPGPGQDIVWTLTGFVEIAALQVAAANGGNARRATFGWFAQTTEVS